MENMPLPRIQLAANRHYLVDTLGRPFFWLGDTAWELFHRLTREEAELYLENRRSKAFTLVQAVALAEFDGLTVPNAYGHLPLHDQDPRRPNEAYFEHVDWVIAAAAARGLYVGLLPTWGDKVNRMWGAGPQIFEEASARTYGEWIGNRYGQTSNVIWILGGDRPERDNEGHDTSGVVRAMALGIRTGAGDHGPILMSYHPCGGRGSAQAFHDDDWLDVNMWQSGHHRQDTPNWEMIAADYRRTPVKPVLDGEPNYEDHPINPWPSWNPENGYFRDYDVRKAAYRSVFAGACGVTYGHHSIWQFYDPAKRQPVNHPWCDWQTALDRPGAFQVGFLRRLVESRPYLTRIPDQAVLVEGAGEGAEYAVATRDSASSPLERGSASSPLERGSASSPLERGSASSPLERGSASSPLERGSASSPLEGGSKGRTLMVYLPTPRTVRVRLDLLGGDPLRAWWFDPRSGQAQGIGDFAGGGERTFTPPSGGPDWVLVVDDAASDFAQRAPGTA
jgi:hypothetical protein